MSDIFREIDESMREDRAKQVWQRYGTWIVAAVVFVVAASAGWVFYQNYAENRDRAQTAELIRASETAAEDTEAGLAAIQSYLQSADGGQLTVARFHEAALLAESGRREDAVAAYRLIAEQTQAPWSDAATVLAVLHDLDNGDPASLRDDLTPLAAGTSPWRFSAREMVALLYSREGRIADAIPEWQALADSEDAPPGIRSRASEMLALHDGQAAPSGS
ncbi:tetratricopeptide repeat protein [Fodinicurvata sp. EGI_FJ10296]|uniref:tetratricopeptide repeat protein n=1 Tax=Fodinicurvata sp. EGI_FJ10296 TaxID=3231908 RepID=UPI003456EB37